jgi:toxin HigB-1
MISSFACKQTEALFVTGKSAKFSTFASAATRKLQMLSSAQKVEDLKMPPGNRLEALRGNRRGQHSVRINDQWRLCFVWRNDAAWDVEIVDYH